MPQPVKILPVIMSGGSGTRLWPLSTEASPKQFHALGSRATLIQETVLRLRGPREDLTVLDPIIISAHRHAALVEQQLADVGVTPGAVVLEPCARNTAAVAGVAAALGAEIDPEALVLLAPADHVIRDPGGFLDAIARGAAAAGSHIVTFGIHPTGPETGYGYIQRDEPVAEGVYSVARFAEKPKKAVAEFYLAEGTYDWNAGIFLFLPEVMRRELHAARPDIADAAAAALEKAERHGLRIDLHAETFAVCPSESIDYAVMEKTRHAAVVPCDIGWADMGSWGELWRDSEKDHLGNVRHGSTILVDSERCLVWAESRVVAVVGLEDVVVVETEEGVLVLPRARAQDVKPVVDQLRSLRVRPGAGS